MRILHVIHSANPAGGGPIEAVRQFGFAHVEDGHHVEVLSLDSPSAPWLAHFPLPICAVGPSSQGYGHTPRLIPWLKERVRRYDIVLVHGLWQYCSFGTWRALRGTGIPFVVFPHGMLDPWFKRRHPLKHLKKWLYWPWAEYRVLRDAHRVLFTCDEEKRQARRSFWLYRCRETVVNLGIADPGESRADEQPDLFLAAFPGLRNKRVILFLGRMHEKKGCSELLHAFKETLTNGTHVDSDISLVMAGPGEERYLGVLQKLVQELGIETRVVWTGMLEGDMKWGALRAAEAFILPSHQENFGIAVVEALACGAPVLLSNKVNIWREIAGDGAGLIENDDIPGTVALLRRWFAFEEWQRRDLRETARDCFLRRFEIREAATNLTKVLEEIVEQSRPNESPAGRAVADAPVVREEREPV